MRVLDGFRHSKTLKWVPIRKQTTERTSAPKYSTYYPLHCYTELFQLGNGVATCLGQGMAVRGGKGYTLQDSGVVGNYQQSLRLQNSSFKAHRNGFERSAQ